MSGRRFHSPVCLMVVDIIARLFSIFTWQSEPILYTGPPFGLTISRSDWEDRLVNCPRCGSLHVRKSKRGNALLCFPLEYPHGLDSVSCLRAKIFSRWSITRPRYSRCQRKVPLQ